MSPESPEIEQAATLLAEEILQTHAAGVHQFASQSGDPAVQFNCVNVAQCSFSAAAILSSEGRHLDDEKPN